MEVRIMIYGGGTYENYRAALAAAGARPVRLCEGIPPEDCHGLLLPGGGDIDAGGLAEEEGAVIGAFICSGRPVLGICRGMQALNVWHGGTLYDRVVGHQSPRGDILHATRADGLLARLMGRRPRVNSNHHQAIKRPGRGLRVCQWAPDGVAEAIVCPARPVLGVQWHPERQSFALKRADAADAAPLFHCFFEWARVKTL